jgi:hypothetical protein
LTERLGKMFLSDSKEALIDNKVEKTEKTEKTEKPFDILLKKEYITFMNNTQRTQRKIWIRFLFMMQNIIVIELASLNICGTKAFICTMD